MPFESFRVFLLSTCMLAMSLLRFFFIGAFEPRKWTVITENRNQINIANKRALVFAFRPNIHVHNRARMSKCITMQQKPAVLRYYQPNRYHLYGIYVHEISAFVRANKLYVQKR